MYPSDTFIDWLDLKQDHKSTWIHRNASRRGGPMWRDFQGTPEEFAAALEADQFKPFDVYHGGVYARGDAIVDSAHQDGKIYYLLSGATDDPKNSGFGFKRGFHEGSHSTKVGLKSDGRIVHISGNVGRVDRANNLWNYGLADTVLLANQIIRSKGLNIPEFTRGEQFCRESISEVDRKKGVSPWYWSGAVCNEIHITRNHYAGSDLLAVESMRDMRGRRLARVSKAAFGDETINFGMPTRKGQRLHKAVVVYRKGPEMMAHAKGPEQKKIIAASDEYQMAMDLGIVRVECKFGSHYLRENNQRYLGDLDMAKLIALFNRETAPLLLARPDNAIRLVEDMPAKLRLSALSWIDGRDLHGLLSLSTFKRHRKALIAYGLDISEPRNLANGRPNAEEALQRMLDALPQHRLQPLAAPDWYGLPEVERMAA